MKRPFGLGYLFTTKFWITHKGDNMRSIFIIVFSFLISPNARAGFLLQCDKAWQACPYFSYCDEAEKKFSCGKEPNSFDDVGIAGIGPDVDSTYLIAGADPCSLCAKDPRKWPGACEMCYGPSFSRE